MHKVDYCQRLLAESINFTLQTMLFILGFDSTGNFVRLRLYLQLLAILDISVNICKLR